MRCSELQLVEISKKNRKKASFSRCPEYEMTAKEAPFKLGKDMVLAEKIKDLIADKNYSPYAIIQTFKNTS